MNRKVVFCAFLCCRDEKRFRQTLLHRIDTNNGAFLYLNTANRWLGIRLVTNLVVLC